MKENKKQSSKSQTKNSKETTKNTETKTGLSNVIKLHPPTPGTSVVFDDAYIELTNNTNKKEFTDEIIRKVFIKNAHHKDGGALGILLPKEVKTKMGLKRGDYVFIKASNDMIIIRKCVTNGAES